MKTNIKRILVFTIAISILINNYIFRSEATYTASTEVNSIKEKVEKATDLLEYLLKDEYEVVLENINKEIIEKGYDQTTSLESIYNKDSIFAGADYVSLIAAYMEVANNKLTIHDIDFIKYSCVEESLTYKVPYKTYQAVRGEDGTISKGRVKYISEDGTHEILTEDEDGSLKVEKKKIKLEEKNVIYGNYTLSLITPEELLSTYGNIDENNTFEPLKAAFDKRKELLTTAGINVNGLSESIMLNLSNTSVISEEAKSVLEKAIGEADDNTRAILITASSLLGMVPYLWGGKPTKPGYDTSWWTIESGKQKGLDCSGYVAWTFLSAGYENWNNLYSTGSILSSQEYISKDELKPGDLGLLNHGESVNHVGIYVGDGYFLHCSSSKQTVVMNQFPFTIFMRVSNITNLITPDIISLQQYEVNEYERDLLAKTVSHEAKGQGLNGWIGVLEVIFNRINSDKFDNTVEEVIYAPGQFQYSEEIYLEEPSENIYAAVDAFLDGKIRILNDPDILYFRNPPLTIEDRLEDWGGLEAVKEINDHVFYKEKIVSEM